MVIRISCQLLLPEAERCKPGGVYQVTDIGFDDVDDAVSCNLSEYRFESEDLVNVALM